MEFCHDSDSLPPSLQKSRHPAMPIRHEKSPDYGGPEPGRGWLMFLAILGVVVLFAIEYFR
jgi:hypothetical protein